MSTFSKPTKMEDFTGPTKESGGQIVYQHCPVCGSSRWKLYVNPETGYWFCHDPNHSGGGKVDVGLSLSNRGHMLLEGRADKGREQWHEVQLPAYQPLCRRALRYLVARGISETHAARLGIVEMEDCMRIIIPYFGPDGRIIYWNARSYSKLEEGPKYLGASGRHPLYVQPNWTPTETVVVVEGAFDAIAVAQHTDYTVASLGGKYLPRYLTPDLLDLCTDRLVLLLDSDALADALKLRSRLQTKRQVTIKPLPVGEDPASLGAQLKGML